MRGMFLNRLRSVVRHSETFWENVIKHSRKFIQVFKGTSWCISWNFLKYTEKLSQNFLWKHLKWQRQVIDIS